jgi:ATP-dependent DNA helicase RecG
MAKTENPITDMRPYMDLAIKEMKKSINEPRKDGKVAPKVGAIVLFPDGDVVRAHRGELRNGDHAEYILLERKLADRKLDDCILFTTLEPCVVRNSPKIACCLRTTNARIKTVYVGIEDPDKTVDGKGIKHLEENGVRVIMFDRDLQKLIEEENSEFILQANERKKRIETIVPDSEFEKMIPNAEFSDFSDDALNNFIVEAGLNLKITDKDFKTKLVDVGALKYEPKSRKYRPTGVGILLFGKSPRAKYKQAALMAYVDYGEGNIEPITFDQPLVLIPKLIEEWLKKTLPLSKDTQSFKRKDVPNFPIDVLREAVINAIVHRDYSLTGAKSSLEIDTDIIKIKSPGAPLPSITLEQLNTFSAPSISRNPIITYVFGLMNYVEEKGFGMRALKSLNEQYGLPLPEYIFENPFLALIFPRNIQAVRKLSKNPSLNKLSDEELGGYQWLKSQVEVSPRLYAKHIESSTRTARRHLSNMLKLGLLETNEEGLRSPKLTYRVKIRLSKHPSKKKALVKYKPNATKKKSNRNKISPKQKK